MSGHTVTQIGLAADANQTGTGTHFATNWVVDPATVPGTGLLGFHGLDVEVTTMLFAIDAKVVPNWFGVAVPFGISDFSRPNLFFHPTPGQAHYDDSQYWSPNNGYLTKDGKWPSLFYYMDRLGYQLDGARRNQVLVMPFLTETAKDTGLLPTDWQDILTQILVLVRKAFNPSDTSPLNIAQLVVSSFSAGILYSYNFRATATGLDGVLAEVWDLDGEYSSYRSRSEALHSTATVQAIKYDQLVSSDPSAYHVPGGRWANYVQPPSGGGDVHGLIRDFMFLHAATLSEVGSVISGPAAGTAVTHTAAETATATHSGTGMGTATHMGTATGTAKHTGSATHSATGVGTATHSATATQSAAGTAMATHSAASTATATHSVTATHSATGTGTATLAITATQSGGPAGRPARPPVPPAPAPAGPPVPPASPVVAPMVPAPVTPGVQPATPAFVSPPCLSPPCVAIPLTTVHQNRCGEVAIPAIVAASAATAQAAQTALVAAAARSRRRR